MCADQLESAGSRGMIERGVAPGIRVVARETGGREARTLVLVVVVLLVARNTVVVVSGLEQQSEIRHRVAVLTRERCVRAD